MPALATAPTLRTLLSEQSLEDSLSALEGTIRRAPRCIEHRLLAFDLLCLLGDWQRALSQLQITAQLDASRVPEAFVYRELVLGEVFRAEVFAGKQRPILSPDAPAWLSGLLDALHEEDPGRADDLREEALSLVEETPGHIITETETRPFAWICDSDSRLGPVLEGFLQGQYRWIPFADIRNSTCSAPQCPRDLLWLPATVHLHQGETLHGFIPARYPGSEQRTDNVRLCRETRWENCGRTVVRGFGQKMWTTDLGDAAAYDVRELCFASGDENDC